jgi:hypothetical protein
MVTGRAAPASEEELRGFIAYAEESSVVEYKQAFRDELRSEASKQEFAKDFCSFLNHGDGLLIFGVADGISRRLTPILTDDVPTGIGQQSLESLKSRIVEAKKLIVGPSLSQQPPVETSMCSYERIFPAAGGGYYIVFGFRERPRERCYVLRNTEDGVSEGWPYGRNTKGVQVPAPDEVVRAIVTQLTVDFVFTEGCISQNSNDMLMQLKVAQGFNYRVDKETKRHQLVKDLVFTCTATDTTDEEIYGALIQALAPVSFKLFFVDDPERSAPEKVQVLDAIETIGVTWQTKGLSAMPQRGTAILFPPEVTSRYSTQEQWRCLQGCFSQDAFQAAGATVPLLNLGSLQPNSVTPAW